MKPVVQAEKEVQIRVYEHTSQFALREHEQIRHLAVFAVSLEFLGRVFRAGITTVEQALKYSEEFSKNAKETKKKATAKKSRGRNRFVNFDGGKVDYDEIRKLEKEYIKSIIGDQK
ncbi:hypothetical protein AGMMS49975_07020 [Clostridia bacterium]|nr:hypothetical protein AGMMS49975_07020 [Clostridia bacterium]